MFLPALLTGGASSRDVTVAEQGVAPAGGARNLALGRTRGWHRPT